MVTFLEEAKATQNQAPNQVEAFVHMLEQFCLSVNDTSIYRERHSLSLQLDPHDLVRIFSEMVQVAMRGSPEVD